MDLLLGSERIRLSDADLLGEGGEAKVYRHRELALKVFHPNVPGLPQKLKKLKAFPTGLPSEVIAPSALLTDRRGRLLGYAMPRVEGAEDLMRLSQRGWREGTVSNADVTRLFAHLHRVLDGVHQRGVVVGDLNDCNVLFAGVRPRLIDADSMQFGGFPCPVGHERFLDPLLHGCDLPARPSFSPGSDWYAFAVQLFSSLLYVHPFGGTHPKLPTLLRRAEARHSVFRSDVRYPRGATPWSVLPDDLLQHFEAVFERDVRTPFPASLLSLQWRRCGCGAEHARPTCPSCSSSPAPTVREVIVHHGRCRAQVLLETTGRVLAATWQGGLRFLYEEAGVLRREDRTEVPAPPLRPDLRFALSGTTTWIGEGGNLVAVRREHPVLRAAASLHGRTPSFDTNSTGALIVQGDWLVSSEGARLGKVLAGQTWIRTGERLAFGFYRAGQCTFYFLVRDGRPGLREVKLPPISGRLLDAACAFDDHHVLFSVATEKDGVRTHAVHLVSESGDVLGSRSGPPDADRVLESIGGKALLSGRMLTLTDDGLLSLRVDPATARIEEGTLFPDTRPFVSADAQLLAAQGGAAIVVAPRSVTCLTLSP